MKNTLLLSILFCFSLFGCHSRSDLLGEMKTIDMNQAFGMEKSILLSDLVKSVEIVQFHPSMETYFVNARSLTVGEKYILIADDRGGGTSNLLLCERNGKFVRNIGRIGNGPGEFLNAWLTLMDPSENYIIIADDQSNKLIKYSVSGEFIHERTMDELPDSYIFDDARFINENEFVFIPRRPVKAIDGFASMLVYDLDLNPSGKILPRANDENLPLFNNLYQLIGEGPDRLFYWEPYFDTLYTINPDHSTEATHVIGWSKGGPSFDYMKTFTYKLPPHKQYPTNFIYSISETKQYFFISGMAQMERFSAVYNKKSEELFLLTDKPECNTSSDQTSSIIKNDLFGIEPVYIRRFDRQTNRYVAWMRAGMVASENDLDCIRNKEVKLPEIRDQLLEIAESDEDDNKMVLLLMEAGKSPSRSNTSPNSEIK